jgi:hypothetical protein
LVIYLFDDLRCGDLSAIKSTNQQINKSINQ